MIQQWGQLMNKHSVNHVDNVHLIAQVIVVILTLLHRSTIHCYSTCSIIFYKVLVSFAYILGQAEVRLKMCFAIGTHCKG